MAVSETMAWRGAIAQRDVPAWVWIAVAVAASSTLHLLTPFNHDEAWFLLGARTLLKGGIYGRDVIDYNPPLVWWISEGLVRIAALLHLPVETVATLFTALAGGAALVGVNAMLRDALAPRPRGILIALAGLVLLMGPGYAFGQREHWLTIFSLPYIVACGRRADGAPLGRMAGASAGALAALGFCLKPAFLLVPLALELWLLIRHRSWRQALAPETVALVVTGCGYAVAIAIVTPLFLTASVPVALRSYWVFLDAPSDVLAVALRLCGPVLVAMAAALWVGRRDPSMAGHVRALAIAGTAALAGSLLERTAWFYHFLPPVLLLTLCAIAILADGWAQRTRAADRVLVALMLVLALLIPARFAWQGVADTDTARRVARLTQIFREDAGPNGAVLALMSSPRDVIPAALAAGVRWPFPIYGPLELPAAIRADEAPKAMRAILRSGAQTQADALVAAIAAHRPAVLVVDSAPYKLGFGDRRFDYLAWFKAHTAIAPLLAQYRETDRVGNFRILTLQHH